MTLEVLLAGAVVLHAGVLIPLTVSVLLSLNAVPLMSSAAAVVAEGPPHPS